VQQKRIEEDVAERERAKRQAERGPHKAVPKKSDPSGDKKEKKQ
jgi:hypothetical protein